MNIEENTKILIIVDDSIVRESIASYLSKVGYRVSLSSVLDSIENFHSFVPDLILCDLKIEGIVASEMLRRLFTVAPKQPVIVLADKQDIPDIIEVMKLGVGDYYIKAVTEMEILELSILELSISNNLKRARIISENNSYRKKLEVINQELESSLETFESDQQAGRHVQVSMLPKPPQAIGAYHFNHRVIPSLYLSGDSVDYKPVSKHEVLFYIADVSGHGSSSAFITILLRFRMEQLRREHIRSRFGGDFTPASILTALNKDLIDAGLDKHITMFVGLLDSDANSLTYSVAGHHPLPIIRINEEVGFIKVAKSSFPIGLLEEAEYFEESLSLSNDFSLTLFSDGILETIELETMVAKEKFLLKVVSESEGDFESIKNKLGLNSIANVPDDIAVLNVSKT